MMLANYLEASVRLKPGGLVLDLRGEINSFAKEASKRRLLAYGLSDHYVEISNVTRLSDFVSVLPDEESALSEASVS